MTPIALLREEHRVIGRALDAIDAVAERLAADERVPEGLWAALLDWLRRFADIRHHEKEEQLLFPALLRAGLPREGGPIAVMLDEHEGGRALVTSMAAGSPREQAACARDFTSLLREHIRKEDRVLFPLAEALLDTDTLEQLRREFERADEERSGAQTIAAAEIVLDGLASALESRAGVH